MVELFTNTNVLKELNQFHIFCIGIVTIRLYYSQVS